ncbi:hypothetical protein [Spirosoma koreense]
MKKIVFLLLMVSGELPAQQRIECSISPSFDSPATVQVQWTGGKSFRLIFRQKGKETGPSAAFSWGEDTTRLVDVRMMGTYFQQFPLADTVTIQAQELPNLLKSFQEVSTGAKRLSTLRDDRMLLDGLTCSLQVFSAASNPQELKYSTPGYAGNRLIHQFLQEVVGALKMKSTNPATVNYCMIVDRYME